MNDLEEEEGNRGEERIRGNDAFLPRLPSPSTGGVRTIQRNRRGPMIRPSTLYSIKQITENRNYKDRANSRRNYSNRANRDHESLIESLLCQPLEISSQPSKRKSILSHQSDRYGPPVGDDDFFADVGGDGYSHRSATALSPSVIFTIPCFSYWRGFLISYRNVTLSRAFVLFLIPSILIIVVTVTNRTASGNEKMIAEKLRNSEMAASKMKYINYTDPRNIEKDVTDHMSNLEERGWAIGKDVTMDIGFTDDMTIDQSDRNSANDGVDQTDDRLDVSKDGIDTVTNMKKSNTNTIEHELNKNAAGNNSKSKTKEESGREFALKASRVDDITAKEKGR